VGYRNAIATRRFAGVLSGKHAAARVLMDMALMSQDVDTAEQEARIYFGGHDELARNVYGSDDSKALRRVGERIKELIDAGAIERAVDAYRGRNAEYRLLLDPTPSNGYVKNVPISEGSAEIEVRSASPYPEDDAQMGISGRYPNDNGGQLRPPNGYPTEAPFPVDNSAMGTSKTYPIESGMGTLKTDEWVRQNRMNGYVKNVPLQEDKKYKTSPYPLGDDSSGLPVDNSEGEEQSNQAAAEPPVMATDYAARLRAEVSSRNGNVVSATASAEPDHSHQSVKATANNFARPGSPENPGQGLSLKTEQKGVRRVDTPDQVPAADQAAIELLTADGTDLALASDMLAHAKADPETKSAHARIRQAKYREQLRSAVLNERNRQHSAAAKAAGPCPHGELGGLVPTRAGTPTCVSCRAEHQRQRETA
jgi:hypothetical protein